MKTFMLAVAMTLALPAYAHDKKPEPKPQPKPIPAQPKESSNAMFWTAAGITVIGAGLLIYQNEQKKEVVKATLTNDGGVVLVYKRAF